MRDGKFFSELANSLAVDLPDCQKRKVTEREELILWQK
jgi:hypothetical protein